MLNKKRMLSFVLALAVILSCLIIPNNVNAAEYYDNINEVVSHRHTIKQIVVAFYDSPEYQKNRTNLTNRQYVESLYDAVLGRKYDQGGFDNWVKALDNRRLTRRQVLLEFLKSAEFNNTVVPQYHLEKY